MRKTMKLLFDNIKQVMALILLVSGITYIFATTFLPVKTADSQGLIAFVSFMNLAIGYYLGNTTGMARKDETINKLMNNKNE